MGSIIGFLVLAVAGADGPRPEAPHAPRTVDRLAPAEITELTSWIQRLCPEDLPAGSRLVQGMNPWPLSLGEAVHIGLKSSAAVRFVGEDASACTEATGRACCDGESRGGTVITLADEREDPWEFKTEVLTYVRSVEDLYWSLAQAYAELASLKRAVALTEEVLRRERTAQAAGHGTAADAAEAMQRLEQYRLDLLVQESEVNATERQLRQVLGLSPAASRRIVPETGPVELRVQPDWKDCRMAMIAARPDIAEQRAIVQASALRLLVARGPGLLFSPVDPATEAARSSAADREAQSIFSKQRDYLEQIVHQATHTLARFVLEADAGYQQVETAAKLTAAATRRLETQRASYEQGRITIDRYLEAIHQDSRAHCREARARSSYHKVLAALEETKGTLLESRGITVADPPRPRLAAANPACERPEEARPRADREVMKTGGRAEEEDAATDEPAPGHSEKVVREVPTGSTTIRFDITVGRASPVQLLGSFSIRPGRAGVPRE